MIIVRDSDDEQFEAEQWNGKCDDLQAVHKIGFELQAEEGQRTGAKPLVVYDETKDPFNPLRIPLHGWALRNLSTKELSIITDLEFQENYRRSN